MALLAVDVHWQSGFGTCQAAAVQGCICQGRAVTAAVLDWVHVGCSYERRQGTGSVQIGLGVLMTWGLAGRKELVLSRSPVQDDLHVCHLGRLGALHLSCLVRYDGAYDADAWIGAHLCLCP